MYLGFLLIAGFGANIISSNSIQQNNEMTRSEGHTPQPCPETPIVFTAKSELQYIYSPYDDAKQYPPNCDCKFLIMARSANHRIQLRVIESEMEEPLFTVCNDYCAIYDGDSDRSPEIAKWCGSNAPIQLSSSHTSVFIHFHSDAVIQKRGFNLSFLDYEVPGCPPNWMIDPSKVFCFKLENPRRSGLTWLEAQTECGYENANLLTFENLEEFEFVYEKFSSSKKMPWVGYYDAEKEGTFATVEMNTPVWPEKFPYFGEQDEQDCVYVDWNLKSVVYAISDCLSRRPFMCKKRLDGTTVPIYVSSEVIMNGFRNSTSQWTIIFLILILALLLIVISFLLWWKYEKSKSRNQVRNVDQNQKLVGGSMESTPAGRIASASQPSRPQHKLSSNSEEVHQRHQQLAVSSLQEPSNVLEVSTSQAFNNADIPREKDIKNLPGPKEIFAISKSSPKPTTPERVQQLERGEIGQNVLIDNESPDRSPRISTTPNQPVPTWTIKNQKVVSETNQGYESDEEFYELRDNDNDFNNQKRHGASTSLNQQIDSTNANYDREKFKNNQQKTMDSLIYREGTMVTTTTMGTVGGQSGIRTRLKRKSFDRPHVGTLDGISAISLDEFWQKNGA